MAYIPQAGDIVWIDLNPRTGHEQAGHRPAIVLSPGAYNSKTGLMLCCPVTTQIKSYPFEVALKGKRASVVLADQVKCLDWRQRKAKRKGRASAEELHAVRQKLRLLIGD